MKKVILTKSAGTDKTNLAYKELIRAMLQIPEKDVQNRILDAVNGRTTAAKIEHALCPNCWQTFGNLSGAGKEVATQTDINDIISHETRQPAIITLPLDRRPSDLNSNTNSDDSRDRDSPALQKSLISSTMTPSIVESEPNKSSGQTIQEHNSSIAHESASTTNEPVKRKRKRKVCLPQVVKRSHTQFAQTQLQPKLKSIKIEKPDSPVLNPKQAIESRDLDILDRRYSISSITSEFLEIFNMPNDNKSNEEHIMFTMAREYIIASERIDGLIAIHRSIVANDLYALRRQIFVWKKLRKEADLNFLLTDEDENCLQLAITQDCYPKIIDVLLNEGLNANEIDDHSNTCIHLALLNEIEPESLRLLMQKIDPKILLQLNDDGYTPLHVAVRTNSYLRAEIMLNVLDKRLGIAPILDRKVLPTSTEADFSKYYEDICKRLEQKYSNLSRNAQPKLKKKFLEAGDRKSGNTALFFAIENKLEHFVFYLLAHLTDPRVLNFSGQDAKSYYSEFGKMLQLSLKVDNAIENVVTLLG